MNHGIDSVRSRSAESAREPLAPVPAAACPRRLLLVCAVRLYREGLAQLLAQALPLAVVQTAASCEEALRAREAEPAEVILLDLSLAGAFETAPRLREHYRGAALIGLNLEEEQELVVAAAEAGFAGFVDRAAGTEELVEAIRCALAGELACSRRAAGALLARVAALARTGPSNAVRLTQRELQIARLLDDGLTNKEIAARLHISAATARNHVHNILERLGVKTRSRAAAVVRRLLSMA